MGNVPTKTRQTVRVGLAVPISQRAVGVVALVAGSLASQLEVSLPQNPLRIWPDNSSR